MRKLPKEFIIEANKQQNAPIDLVLVEVTSAFTSLCQNTCTSTSVTIDPLTRDAISAWEIEQNNLRTYDFETDITNCYNNLASGAAWILGCDEGLNAGNNRLITSYNSSTRVVNFEGAVANSWATLQNSSVPDRVRISKYMFLAITNVPVPFFIPDSQSNYSKAMTYQPFPMSLEPLGSNLTGEIMDMSVNVANVNRLIGNSVQYAGGLRGNRVVHMKVFGDLLGSKDYCVKEVMYIDTVAITPTEVQFKLESKFNILNVEVPLRMYYRDFCGFTYKSPECGFGFSWNPSGQSLDSTRFPLADASKCDHTLRGANGCLAHNNAKRFGGFPTIPPTS